MRLLLQKHYGDAVELPSGKRFDDPAARWEQHHALADIPDEMDRLPVFGFVRNPWDWYVSWYHFFASYDHRPPHFMTVSKDKTLDFAGFMENLATYPPDSEESLYNSYTDKYMRIFSCTADQPRNPRVEMGRYETVHEDLHRFLASVDVDQACLDEIATFRTMNNSRHSHFSTYYTDSLAEQVYLRDRAVIDEFRYEISGPA